jgi:leader peptidase (prepilin peptidase)/N-methyltransferase
MMLDIDLSLFPQWLQILFVIFFGLCIGSFLNVVIYRLPRDKSLVSPSSCCGFCKNKLRPWMNIPVLSFVFTGGQCGFCGIAYSVRYPLVEILTAFMFVGVWSVYGFNLNTGFLSVFAAALIAISFIDLEFRIIPDGLSLGGWAVALLVSVIGIQDYPVSFQSALLGSVVGAGFLWAISRIFYFITKEEGLGGGDIKLIGFIGAVLGLQGVITSILVGSILGSLVGFIFVMHIMKKSKRFPIPFGPFLALGALVNLFQLDQIFWLL